MESPKGTLLAHMVYFTLHDSSPDNRHKLLEACRRYLTGHAGTVFFAAGVVAEEYAREVNVRDFDVALHLVFESRQAHDAYQVAPRHLQFIAEQKANWKQVRVFDSHAE